MFKVVSSNYSFTGASKQQSSGPLLPLGSASTIVVGDSDGEHEFLALARDAVCSASTKTNVPQLIMLGDHLSPYKSTLTAGLPVLSEIMKFRGVKMPEHLDSYETIEDVINTFQSDVLDLLEDRGFENIIDMSEKPRHEKNDRPGFIEFVNKYQYDPAPPEGTDDQNVFILGNNDYSVMLSIAYAKSIKNIDDETARIEFIWPHPKSALGKKFGKSFTKMAEIDITVDMANTIYTYLYYCRLAYVSGNVLYTHYSENCNRILNIPDVKFVVAGHNRMYGAYRTHVGKTFCFIDLSGYYESYDVATYVRLCPRDMCCMIKDEVLYYLCDRHIISYYYDVRITAPVDLRLGIQRDRISNEVEILASPTSIAHYNQHAGAKPKDDDSKLKDSSKPKDDASGFRFNVNSQPPARK